MFADLLSGKQQTDLSEKATDEAPATTALGETEAPDDAAASPMQTDSNGAITRTGSIQGDDATSEAFDNILSEAELSATANAPPMAIESDREHIAQSATRVEPTLLDVTGQPTRPAKNRSKANRAAAPLPIEKRDVTAKDVEDETALVLKSIADEMTYLDREINDLRRQLSEKLGRQNEYLRKLLVRYDAQL